MALHKYLWLTILLQTILINHKFTKAYNNQTYLDSRCSNNMTFAPNSKYQTDLNSVFRSLTSKAAITTSATTMENTVYGLFLCRGDLTTAACQDCVANACLDLSQSYCPQNKVAVIWYTRCMVRYSNESFFGKMEDSPKVIMWNSLNLTRNQTDFKQILVKTIDDLAMHTSNSNTFYANVNKSFGFWGVTAYSQCTPDLTRSDCTRCLKVAVGQMPVSITGRVLQPSCNLWYEVYKSDVNISEIRYPYGKKNHSIEVIVATLAPIASVSIAVLILCLIIRRAKEKKLKTAVRNVDDDCVDVESLRYDLATIISATNNFSSKIGLQHYKGTLANGTEILVKKMYIQEEHFSDKNLMSGVLSHAKLQHKNLLRLLGFCMEGKEDLLIFEYMPYKLDDLFIANEEDRRFDWETRFQIIKGIARGMLYLHQDSRLKIVHRDLNNGNVLLDEHMNPKIAGFDLANVFQSHHDHEFFHDLIRGTYGYICPEYLSHRRVSVQTDVYSFGILILEIISGTRCWDFLRKQLKTDYVNLVDFAREKWTEGRVMEFVDEAIRETVGSINEIKRCVHLGLLCSDDTAARRPTMATVVLMLESHPVALPRPEQPAYMSHDESIRGNPGQSASILMPCSVNNATITELEPR